MRKKTYTCYICQCAGVHRIDGISEEYPDDYLLECPQCGNWEEVGNKRPGCFKEEEKQK